MLRPKFTAETVETNRTSQESKVTSTPRTTSPVSPTPSPSVSTIAREDQDQSLMEIDENVEEPFEDSSTSAVICSLSIAQDSETDSGATGISGPSTVKWTGVSSCFKPKNKERLFYKITTEPTRVRTIVVDLLNNYQEHKEEVLLAILQLFVDLCGYKKLSLNKIYKFNTENIAKKVINQMESELIEPEMKNGKFLFLKYSKLVNAVDKIISAFARQLISVSFKSQILFDGEFTVHIMDFLNSMASSQIRCIRVTGIIIVINLLTAFLDLYACCEKLGGNITNEIFQDKKEIESNIDFLYIMFERNCLLPDKKSGLVKIKGAQEMYHWFHLFPDFFILKPKCFGRLMKLIEDKDESVRFFALASCEKIVKSEHQNKEMKSQIDKLLNVVAGRIVDVTTKNAVKAISVFEAVLDRYPERLPSRCKLIIVHRIFEKNVILAKAAGKFLAKYFDLKYNNDKDVILGILKVAFLTKEFACRLPYFLESLIEFVPQLKDLELLVNLTSDDTIELQSRIRLMAVLNGIMKLLLTGNFPRNPKSTRSTMSEQHILAIQALIPQFKDIVIQFQEELTCLQQLIEILTMMDYDCDRTDDFLKEYVTIFNLLKDLFCSTLPRKVLEQIANAFYHFCECENTMRADIALSSIKEYYMEILTKKTDSLVSGLNMELLVALGETLSKLSILFVKFDLTTNLQWKSIHDVFIIWSESNSKLLQHAVKCCEWYIIWSLRNFIKSSTNNNNGDNFTLHHICKQFVNQCINMLKGNGSFQSFLIYESLCDLYCNFGEELKSAPQLTRYVIFAISEENSKILTTFVRNYVIENTKLPLKQRQKLICKLVDVIFLGVLPTESFSDILCYYNSHFKEFGPVMQTILTQLRLNPPALSCIMVETLSRVYETIIEKHKVMNIMSMEAKQLKGLAKKFANFTMPSSELLKLVNMCLRYAFRKQSNNYFLYFARYFAVLLDDSSKSDAYELFKILKTEEQSQEILLLFAKVLKPST